MKLLTSRPDKVRCFSHIYSLSFLKSGIHSSLRPFWRRTASSKILDTQAPQYPQRNSIFLVLLTNSVFLELAEFRILRAVPVVNKFQTLLISFCFVQLRTHYTTRSMATPFLPTTSGQGLGELSDFSGSMVFRHAPSRGRGRLTTTA